MKRGLLERTGIRITEDNYEALKKSLEAETTVLDSIGTSSQVAGTIKRPDVIGTWYDAWSD